MWFFTITVLVICTGCPKPDLSSNNYLSSEAKDSLTILAFDPVIQKNDILYINVSVAGSEGAQKMAATYVQQNNITSNNLAVSGFLVSPKGTISLPSVGEVEVVGKTKQQVTDLLVDKLRKYLNVTPFVTVRIINYRVYINGEVNKPGAIDVTNEVISLPQAIAIASGFTVYAAKEKVQIIRDMGNGEKKIVYIDLRYEDLLDKQKEYFYLKQNDQIFVQANKEKIISSNQSTVRTVSYATAGITLLLTFFNLFR